MFSMFQLYYIIINYRILRKITNLERNHLENWSHQYRQLLNIRNLLLLMRDMVMLNQINVSPSNCSTQFSENNNNQDNGNLPEENFEKKETKNIVVENHEEYNVEINIDNFSPDKENKISFRDNRRIDLNNIRLSFDPSANSEEIKIQNKDDIDNIINNH